MELLRVGRVTLRDELRRLRMLPSSYLAFCHGGLCLGVVELRLGAVSLIYEHGHHWTLANAISIQGSSLLVDGFCSGVETLDRALTPFASDGSVPGLC